MTIFDEYNRTSIKRLQFNKQTLNDILDKSYLHYVTLLLSIIYWIYNDGISFVFNNLVLGIFSIIFILPLTMGFFTIILMILNTVITSIIKFYHPLTKSVISYKKDLNKYKFRLNKYNEEQEKLKKNFGIH